MKKSIESNQWAILAVKDTKLVINIVSSSTLVFAVNYLCLSESNYFFFYICFSSLPLITNELISITTSFISFHFQRLDEKGQDFKLKTLVVLKAKFFEPFERK